MSQKIAVTLNLNVKAWRAFQAFCEGNAIGYSHTAETALIAMMRRAGCWPPKVEAQKVLSAETAAVVE